MNGLSDYYHRMALFTGYIYEGGFMDAYDVNPNSNELIYNFEKDPRFKNVREVIKGGKVDSNDKGLALYNMMIASFNKNLPSNKQLTFGDALPDGFTQEQLQTIHTLLNLIHGNLDGDTQMHARNFMAGKIFLKFINFIGAKNTALSLSGGRYNMYESMYEVDPASGEQLYIKLDKDDEGNVIGTKTTTDNNDSTRQKVVK